MMKAPIDAQQMRAAFPKGTWVRIVLDSGTVYVVRIDCHLRRLMNDPRPWVAVDRGRYGEERDDTYIPVRVIASIEPAERPRFVLSVTYAHGFGGVTIGRFETREIAQAHADGRPPCFQIGATYRIEEAKA